MGSKPVGVRMRVPTGAVSMGSLAPPSPSRVEPAYGERWGESGERRGEEEAPPRRRARRVAAPHLRHRVWLPARHTRPGAHLRAGERARGAEGRGGGEAVSEGQPFPRGGGRGGVCGPRVEPVVGQPPPPPPQESLPHSLPHSSERGGGQAPQRRPAAAMAAESSALEVGLEQLHGEREVGGAESSARHGELGGPMLDCRLAYGEMWAEMGGDMSSAARCSTADSQSPAQTHVELSRR